MLILKKQMKETLLPQKEIKKPSDEYLITQIASQLYELERNGTDIILLENDRRILGTHLYSDLPKQLRTKYMVMAKLALEEVKIIDRYGVAWDEISLETCSFGLFTGCKETLTPTAGEKQDEYSLLSENNKEPYRSTIRIAVQCVHPEKQFPNL